MQRRHSLAMLGLVMALAANAAVWGAESVLELKIVKPEKDGFALFINQTAPVAASITGASGDVSIRWSATSGSFIDPFVATTEYVAPDYKEGGHGTILIFANAWESDRLVSTARRSSVAGTGRINGSSQTVHVSVPATGAGGAAELEAYKQNWGSKIGDPPSVRGGDFMHELNLSDHAPDRDGRVKHLSAALALRPNNPANILIEFYLAIELGQHEDRERKQTVMPKEAQAICENILSTYDHKAYYRQFPEGSGDATELIIPRVAIWASEYALVISKDRATAQKHAQLAIDSLDWTFRKRTSDWINAPKPEANPFLDRFGRAEGRLAAWEKNKATAEAGNAVGPYDASLAAAMVNLYVKTFAENGAAEGPLLKQLSEKYPKSPISRAVEARVSVAKPAAATRPAVQAGLP